MKEKIFLKMNEKKSILLDKKYILVITDSHFKNSWAAIKPFCSLLDSLSAKDYHLVLLGDLFHCWMNIEKTILCEQKKLLQFLVAFRKKGGSISFIAGNRDIFFKKKKLSFTFGEPFNYVGYSSLVFHTKNKKKILFEHGDLINQQDKRYLLWRKFIRSSFLKICFYLIPSLWTQKLLVETEKKMKNTNRKQKKLFPKEEWYKFLSKQSAYQLCVIGHFHPPKTHFEEYKFNKTVVEAIILKAWMDAPVYLLINEKLQVTLKKL